MNVAIELPEDVASQLQSQRGNLSRQIIESIALEGYRSGVLGHGQIQRLLEFSSWWETEEFLQRKRAYLHYDENDLEQDAATLRRVNACDGE